MQNSRPSYGVRMPQGRQPAPQTIPAGVLQSPPYLMMPQQYPQGFVSGTQPQLHQMYNPSMGLSTTRPQYNQAAIPPQFYYPRTTDLGVQQNGQVLTSTVPHTQNSQTQYFPPGAYHQINPNIYVPQGAQPPPTSVAMRPETPAQPAAPPAQRQSRALQIIDPATNKPVSIGPSADSSSETSSRSTPSLTTNEGEHTASGTSSPNTAIPSHTQPPLQHPNHPPQAPTSQPTNQPPTQPPVQTTQPTTSAAVTEFKTAIVQVAREVHSTEETKPETAPPAGSAAAQPAVSQPEAKPQLSKQTSKPQPAQTAPTETKTLTETAAAPEEAKSPVCQAPATQTPATSVTQTPATEAKQTPTPQATQTPTSVTQTPATEATQTPATQTTQTPAPQAKQTPAPKATQTPATQTTQTPAPKATQTPATQTTQTPATQTTQTPATQTTQTSTSVTQTPATQTTQTPTQATQPSSNPQDAARRKSVDKQKPKDVTPPQKESPATTKVDKPETKPSVAAVVQHKTPEATDQKTVKAKTPEGSKPPPTASMKPASPAPGPAKPAPWAKIAAAAPQPRREGTPATPAGNISKPTPQRTDKQPPQSKNGGARQPPHGKPGPKDKPPIKQPQGSAKSGPQGRPPTSTRQTSQGRSSAPPSAKPTSTQEKPKMSKEPVKAEEIESAKPQKADAPKPLKTPDVDKTENKAPETKPVNGKSVEEAKPAEVKPNPTKSTQPSTEQRQTNQWNQKSSRSSQPAATQKPHTTSEANQKSSSQPSANQKPPTHSEANQKPSSQPVANQKAPTQTPANQAPSQPSINQKAPSQTTPEAPKEHPAAQPKSETVEKVQSAGTESKHGKETKQPEKPEQKSAKSEIPTADQPATNGVAETEKKSGETEDELEDGEIIDDEEPAQPKLRFTYKEGQWSPMNPQGMKTYDREFLLQFRPLAKSKPDLPPIPDIMRMDSGARDASHKVPFTDFSPGYIRSAQSYKGRRGSGQRGMSRSGPRGEQKVIQIQRPQEVELNKAENPWLPSMKNTTNDKPLERKVTTILNKVTPEKFEVLMGKLQELVVSEITKTEDLSMVIGLLHKKATQEHSYSVSYAQMCARLSNSDINLQDLDIQKGDRQHAIYSLMRKLIILPCQKEFERELYKDIDVAGRTKAIKEEKDTEKRDYLREELDIEMSKDKKRALGNVKFVAELFKLKLMTEKVLHEHVIKGLLKRNEDDKLEMLCMLLKTCGEILDSGDAKIRMDQYFEQMGKIQKNMWCSQRISFSLQDIIELRQRSWKPDRKVADPRTREQLHNDRILEEHKEKIELEGHRQAARGSQQGRNRHTGDDGFTTVPSRLLTSQNFEPAKMKLSKHNVDNMRLGPGGAGYSWNKGKGANADRPPTPNRMGNRFQLLDDGGSGSRPRQDSRERGPPNRSSRGGSDRGHDRTMGPPTGRAPRNASGPRGSRGTPSRQYSEDYGHSRSRSRDELGGRRSSRDRADYPPHRRPMRQDSRPERRDGSRHEERRDGSRHEERRDSFRHEGYEQPAKPGPTKPVVLDRDEIKRKVTEIIDEYLHTHELAEALHLTSQLPSANMADLVTDVCEHVLDKNAKFREMTGKYFSELVGNRVISGAQFASGMETLCEFAPDLEVDMPLVYDWLGELLAPLLQQQTLRFIELRSTVHKLKEVDGGKPVDLIVGVLKAVSSHMGHIKACEMLARSPFKLKEFFSSADELTAYLKKKNAEWLADTGPRQRTISEPDTVDSTLHELIVEQHQSNETLFDWIEQHVTPEGTNQPRFIQTLVTHVFNENIEVLDDGSAKVSQKRLVDRFTVLNRFIDGTELLEVVTLLAMEAVVHNLQHPSDLLRSLFELCYEEELLSEESFHSWRQAPDPPESRGVAISSVSAFFEWLKFGQNEDDQNS